MKVQYIASACVIVEHQGVKVLCDPWLTDGIYYGTWYHYPPLTVTPEDFSDVDYIYISHIHPDHMDQETLKRLPKTIPILIHSYSDKFIVRILKTLGFEQVIEIEHQQEFQLGPDFIIEILAADNCDPVVCGKHFGCTVPDPYKNTIQIDTLAVFHGSGQTVVNTNDCQYELSYKVCDYIIEKYKNIDFLSVGYLSAVSYPQCFNNLDDEAKLKKAAEIQATFLNKTIKYIKHLKAPRFHPFAGQYLLGGRQYKLNAFRSTPEMEELEEKFGKLLAENHLDADLILLNSGEYFDVSTNTQSAPFQPPDPKERNEYVENVLSQKKYLYEGPYLIEKDNWVDLTSRLEEARLRMYRHQERLNYFSDWKVYLDTGQDFLYMVSFQGTEISKVERGNEETPYLTIYIDYSLLNMILNRQAHWNNSDISSHFYYYRNPDVYERQVYMLLSYFHC